MRHKTDAIMMLVEEKLPLFTQEIRSAFSQICIGPPIASCDATLQLIKLYPDHFAQYISYKTDNHIIEGDAVWTNPDTGHDFHDVDVEIVRRYLEVAYSLSDRLERLPSAILRSKLRRAAEAQRNRNLAVGEIEDEERYFSLPSAMASDPCWTYWSGLPYLTSDECAALSMGLNPGLVSLDKVENAVGSRMSVFLHEYQAAKRIFDRTARHPERQTSRS